MQTIAKRLILFLLSLLLLLCLVSCGKKYAEYDGSEDAPFLPKDIYSEALFIRGIEMGKAGTYSLKKTQNDEAGTFILKGEYGKCYEVKIPAGVAVAKAGKFSSDPRALSDNEVLYYSSTTAFCHSTAPKKETSFMYTCRVQEEYLAIYTGSDAPIYIGERSILSEEDTKGPWYIPETVGSIKGDCTLGDVTWTSDEFLTNLYEPSRALYPDYITRESIGKDESGTYDMYCYIYEPKDYKTTVFLTAGLHGDEEVGYFSLAKIMQLIADAKPEDTLLYTLRQRVRFVVIPIVNVWSVSTVRRRTNSTGQDLNRDFENLTQAEAKNVSACFERYALDASIAMDFHISVNESVELWFNFINYTDNAVANYKTTNHMYHRYFEEGYTAQSTDLIKIPGSYKKSNRYLEGYIYNEFGVPTITVEYTTNSKTPAAYSSECMTLAVETYINFIIQNSLFFLQGK